jgi:hypothetical protein
VELWGSLQIAAPQPAFAGWEVWDGRTIAGLGEFLPEKRGIDGIGVCCKSHPLGRIPEEFNWHNCSTAGMKICSGSSLVYFLPDKR